MSSRRLRLPAPAPKLSDACTLEEALVDLCPYTVDEKNNTTAYALTMDGRTVQVSFHLAQPPRVSYFCVSCTNMPTEPRLLATEGNLALFILKHGSYRTEHEYYIYRSPVAADGVMPVLEKVGHPEPDLFRHSRNDYFHPSEVGILRYPDGTRTLRRQHSRGDHLDAYKIAVLRTHDTLNPRGSRCNLYTYDSQTKAWDRKPTVLEDQQYEDLVEVQTSHLVINLGGDVGTMGWVNLERGIILCDVLGGKDDSPTSRLLRYIPMPDVEPVKEGILSRAPRPRYRTVAAVRGRIELVEVQNHIRPGPRPKRLNGTFFTDGWTVVRWSTTAAAGSSGWHMDSMLTCSDITVPADMAALLPALPKDIDDDATTLERLHVGFPTISFGDDSDIVYFMAKIDEMEDEAWVIAVDTKKKVLQGVSEFAPRHIYSPAKAYIPTTIS